MEYEFYEDVVDAYEAGIGVEPGDSLTDYIRKNNIKIKEIEPFRTDSKDGGLMYAYGGGVGHLMEPSQTYHQYHDFTAPMTVGAMVDNMYNRGGRVNYKKGGWNPGVGRDKKGYQKTSPHYSGGNDGNNNPPPPVIISKDNTPKPITFNEITGKKILPADLAIQKQFLNLVKNKGYESGLDTEADDLYEQYRTATGLDNFQKNALVNSTTNQLVNDIDGNTETFYDRNSTITDLDTGKSTKQLIVETPTNFTQRIVRPSGIMENDIAQPFGAPQSLSVDPYADGGRVNYNQGSNWWDNLSAPGMNVYNAMKDAGHDDSTIQGQLSLLGYYDADAGSPDPTPDPTPGQGGSSNAGGGDNFSVYNPDPNTIKTVKQDPAIQANLEAIQRNQQLQSMGINDPFANEQDPANAYYGDMPEDTSNLTGKQSMFAKAKQGLVGLMDNPITDVIGFALNPAFGVAKNVLKGIGSQIPVNQRAIQENIMGNMGFVVNDIGQIVSTGDYDDPENVMAGYNLNKMTPQTFMKRIASIKNRKAAQTDASRRRIAAIEKAQAKFEAAEKLKRLAVEEAKLKKGKAPSGGTWDGGGGPAYTNPNTGVGGGQFTDSMNNVDYQDPYDVGGGEKDGGIIGYRNGGLASMFTRKR